MTFWPRVGLPSAQGSRDPRPENSKGSAPISHEADGSGIEVPSRHPYPYPLYGQTRRPTRGMRSPYTEGLTFLHDGFEFPCLHGKIGKRCGQFVVGESMI